MKRTGNFLFPCCGALLHLQCAIDTLTKAVQKSTCPFCARKLTGTPVVPAPEAPAPRKRPAEPVHAAAAAAAGADLEDYELEWAMLESQLAGLQHQLRTSTDNDSSVFDEMTRVRRALQRHRGNRPGAPQPAPHAAHAAGSGGAVSAIARCGGDRDSDCRLARQRRMVAR